jgi:glycerophosphoryl diester phosphodiesterase
VANDPETYAAMTTPAGLRDVATYATWLGPDIRQLLPVDAAATRWAPPRW